MHGALGGTDEAGAHLHALGSQREGGNQAGAIDDAAGGEHRHLHGFRDHRREHHGRGLTDMAA